MPFRFRWLALMAGLFLGGGCNNVANKLGEVNTSLTSINTNFNTAISNQQTAITKQQEVVTRIQQNTEALEKTREATDKNLQKDATAVVDMLRFADPATTPRGDNALFGATLYAGSLQGKLGLYAEADRVRAEEFVNGRISRTQLKDTVELDRKEYDTLQGSLDSLRREKERLDGEIKARNDQLKTTQQDLQQVGSEIKDLKKKVTWDRIVAYFKTPAGIILGIALLIAFPALIPVIGAAVGQLVSVFPALMSYFGVASKGTVDRVAQGVGNFKDELDKAALKGQLTAEEVKAMLRRELLTATDSHDRRVIDHVRTTRNIS